MPSPEYVIFRKALGRDPYGRRNREAYRTEPAAPMNPTSKKDVR
jgi:hypothetical protein